MARTWEKEKAYRAKRAVTLGAELDRAIENADKEAFGQAYRTALGYMTKAERTTYMKRFLQKMTKKNN